MSTSPRPSHRNSFELHNRQKEDLQFVLEPWGEIYAIPPNAGCIVEMESDTPGMPEFQISEGNVIVYAWGGVSVRFVEVNPK